MCKEDEEEKQDTLTDMVDPSYRGDADADGEVDEGTEPFKDNTG